ncbi:aminoglycoside phosphotransferase family protein [Occultella kanbiaonis]|uniref:aminoglycoside phosphotransferase family protein n=1 Tax=Occultella kanbiaonis TaxID=2675754 RepID=UPI0013D827DB|nr:aminoglycoside phosphotransferase family protein [Occultella kanbiaonis]
MSALRPLPTWPVHDLVQHLRARGVDIPDTACATALVGGVSGAVLRLEAGGTSVVVKQALPELAVPGVWRADPRRLLTEAAALRVLHTLAPEHVPEVLDLDEGRLLLTMAAAPADWTTWKQLLLSGVDLTRDATLAEALGRTMRAWHDATRADSWSGALGPREDFAPTNDFVDLRLDPFYGHVARALGGHVGSALTRLADGLLASQQTLVHGDVSPKNILTAGDPAAWWLVDSECAVLSDPVFDVAFALAHLLLKSVDQSRSHAADAAARLWTAYAAGAAPFSEQHLSEHTAALVLARVAGVSQVDYLTDSERTAVREIAVATVLGPTTITDLAETIRAREAA